MLRSGARSSIGHFSGYAFAALCVTLFAYMFGVAVAAAFTVKSDAFAVWILGAAILSLAFVVVATAYVARQPYLGGYFLVALAALTSAFVCLMSFFPLLIW